MDNFYAGEGTDHSGVPTKMVTLNCSLNMVVYNPASMFGIHVSSGPVRLLYSEIAIGVGQVCPSASPAPLWFLGNSLERGVVGASSSWQLICPFLIMVLHILPCGVCEQHVW